MQTNELQPLLLELDLRENATYLRYFYAYDRAVQVLYRNLSEGKESVESLGLPLLHLMRHSLELGYKYVLASAQQEADWHEVPSKSGHSLKQCHERLLRWFETLCARGRMTAGKEASFREHSVATQAIMEEFDRLDPFAMNLRYPTRLDGKPNEFTHSSRADLHALKQQYEDGMTLLRFSVDVFYPDF